MYILRLARVAQIEAVFSFWNRVLELHEDVVDGFCPAIDITMSHSFLALRPLAAALDRYIPGIKDVDGPTSQKMQISGDSRLALRRQSDVSCAGGDDDYALIPDYCNLAEGDMAEPRSGMWCSEESKVVTGWSVGRYHGKMVDLRSRLKVALTGHASAPA